MTCLLLIGCETGTTDTTTEVVDREQATASELSWTACDYPQAFGTSQHTGLACPEVNGLSVVRVLTQDPDADAENEQGGFLQIHESPPLTSGDWAVIPSKEGFVSVDDRSPEHWNVQAYRWTPSVTAVGAQLVAAWGAKTDWQPVDAIVGSFGSFTNGYVALFGPVITNNSVYMPGRSGRLIRVNLKTGVVVATINPFAGTAFDGDARTITVSALSFDSFGTVYYTVTAFSTVSDSNGEQPRGSWLVQVRPDNTSRIVDWDTIASPAVGVPGLRDLCEYPFGTLGTPPLTGPGSRPPLFGCGTQRPAINSPVAIGDDGDLVVFSYANNALGAAFLIKVNATTMQPVRAMDTRGHLAHGCGVRLPILHQPDGTPVGRCATLTADGTVNIGNDPDFNGPPRFRGEDIMDNAPTIAPNGDMAIGGFDGGFSFGGNYDARGAGVVFNSAGRFVAKNEQFFWEVTPSVLPHADGSFSYLADRQLYSLIDLGVAQYSPTMTLQTVGTVPTNFDANAIDFLDAHITFGPDGDHYAVNGDGHLYKFDGRGKLADSVELQDADGNIRSMEGLSGYFARDRAGRIYASYAGNVYVIASGDRGPDSTAAARALTATPSVRLVAARAAKQAALAATAAPEPPSE